VERWGLHLAEPLWMVSAVLHRTGWGSRGTSSEQGHLTARPLLGDPGGWGLFWAPPPHFLSASHWLTVGAFEGRLSEASMGSPCPHTLPRQITHSPPITHSPVEHTRWGVRELSGVRGTFNKTTGSPGRRIQRTQRTQRAPPHRWADKLLVPMATAPSENPPPVKCDTVQGSGMYWKGKVPPPPPLSDANCQRQWHL